MFNDSDEYDFNPSTSSKLATLFGSTKDSFNSSLTYTAPKQPKTIKEQEVNEAVKSKPQTSVLLAKIVSLWILENKDYKSLGKHGLAVIGSTELNLYEIIAYKEKNNILLRIKINDEIRFYNKKDCFSTFYDNDNQNWLAKFENTNHQNLFCKTIESHGAKIVNNTEDTVGNEKVQTKTTEKRDKVTDAEEISHNNPQEDFSVGELDVNSDSSGSHKRANILSRMAKMGQQILPSALVKNTSTDISDSELDDSKTERKVPPRKFKRAIHAERNISPKEEKPPQMVPQNYVDTQMVPSQNTCNNYPVQLPQSIPGPVYYNQPMQLDGFNHFIMAQNAELKMNLAQISAKLDNALTQNNISQTKTEDSTLKSKIKVLELRASNLENELARYDRKYSNLKKMYKELEEKYDNEKGQCTDEGMLQDLKQEIDKLHVNIRDKEDTIIAQEALKNSLEKCRDTIQEHAKTIELQKIKIKDLEMFYEENKGNTDLQLTIDMLNETVLSLNKKLKDLEEYHERTEEEKQKRSDENEEFVNMFGDKIKEYMNSMYQSILKSFHEGNSYSVSDINASIAQNLKGTTFKIINELKSIYTNKDIE